MFLNIKSCYNPVIRSGSLCIPVPRSLNLQHWSIESGFDSLKCLNLYVMLSLGIIPFQVRRLFVYYVGDNCFWTTESGNELNPFVELCLYDKLTNIFLIYLRRQGMYRSLEKNHKILQKSCLKMYKRFCSIHMYFLLIKLFFH